MKTIIIAILLAVGAMTVQNAHASFNLSLRTTITDFTNSATARLFNLGAPSGPGVDPSETTDPLWFVIDLDGDGVFQPGALSGLTYDGTVSNLVASMIDPDDFLWQGAVASGVEGRTLQNILSVPTIAQTGGSGPADIGGTVKPGFAILFDDSSLTNGGSFGFDQVYYGNLDGSTNIPPSGNLNARIGQDVYANTYTFTIGGALPPQPVLSNIVAQASSGNVVLSFSFSTSSGASYQVQSATNLAAPIIWSNELGVMTGSGSVTNVSVTNSLPLNPKKFFRVRAN